MNPTPNFSETILKKQVANILKRANAGKVLSEREEKIISDYQATQNQGEKTTWINTKADLCKRLSIARSTLDGWIKFPDFPKPRANGAWPLEPIIRWIQEKGVKGGETTETQKLKDRVLLAKCRKLEFELEVEKGKYISITDADNEFARLAANAKAVLISRFQNQLPPILEGLTAAQIQEECRKAIHETCEQLSR